MKPATLHSLITARTLYNEAKGLIEANDRHMCTAGLVILQDALEIIFIALLTEMGIDEKKTLESKGFDELIGELKSAGIQVPKSGTLKALNKQRVISKHYGQLAEPVTVRGYAEAADIAVESILPQVLGKDLNDIFLSDLIEEGESLGFLNDASAFIEQKQYLDALIEIRKSIFVEIEYEYAIHKWADYDPQTSTLGMLGFWGKGGNKAYSWTKNKEWIEKNVKTPVDYVQVDHERLRMDAMEWGVNTAELENLRRLTPNVFRPEKDAPWHIEYDMKFPPNEATESNAKYCLDRAVSVLLRKQQHTQKRRWPKDEVTFASPTIYIGEDVYAKASKTSEVVHTICEGFEYRIDGNATGFDPSEKYYKIRGSATDERAKIGSWVSGYLLVKDEIVS